jgi:hypothetical protein
MRTVDRTRHARSGDLYLHLVPSPPPAPRPDVFPAEVYAAVRPSFQVFANASLSGEQVIEKLLEEYPAFEAHGWTERSMRIAYVGQPCARKLWRVERA